MGLTGDVDPKLSDAGFELAGHLLESALSQAESEEQFKNQIIVLQAAAIRIISTAAFNFHKEGGNALWFIDNLSKTVKSDYQWLIDNQDELDLLGSE